MEHPSNTANSFLAFPSIAPRADHTFPSAGSGSGGVTPIEAPGNVDDAKVYKQKYLDIKRDVQGLEESNAQLFLKITRAKRTLERLKFERKLLYEKLESMDQQETTGLTQSHRQIRPITPSMVGLVSTEDDYSGDDSDDISESQPKKKRQKKLKDPNAPKKPANAFFLYCQLEREALKVANPTITRAELTRMLGANWKALSEDDKKKYYDLYEEDKKRYESEMAEYIAPGSTGVVAKIKEDDEDNEGTLAEEEDGQVVVEQGEDMLDDDNQ